MFTCEWLLINVYKEMFTHDCLLINFIYECLQMNFH